jgi:hypothetical protein
MRISTFFICKEAKFHLYMNMLDLNLILDATNEQICNVSGFV